MARLLGLIFTCVFLIISFGSCECDSNSKEKLLNSEEEGSQPMEYETNERKESLEKDDLLVLCDKIGDTLISSATTVLYLTDYIEIVDSTDVRWAISSIPEIPHFESDLMLNIEILDSGLLTINDTIVKLVKLKSVIMTYRNKALKREKRITKKTEEIGAIALPLEGFYLQVRYNADESRFSRKCKLLAEVVDEIRSLYAGGLDQISEDNWGGSFNDLSLSQKVTTMQLANLRTTIVFIPESFTGDRSN